MRGVGVALLVAALLLGWLGANAQGERVSIALPDFPEGAAYVLGRLSNEELLNVELSEPVYLAIAIREGVAVAHKLEAIAALADLRGTDRVAQILDGVARIEAGRSKGDGALRDLVRFLMSEPGAVLAEHRAALVTLATDAKRNVSREAGYAGVILADGDGESGWALAEASLTGLIDLLNGVSLIMDSAVRTSLYSRVEGVIDSAPSAAVRRAAILAIAQVSGDEAETFGTLAAFVHDDDERDTAIAALHALPSAGWPKSQLEGLAESIVNYAEGVAPENRNASSFKRALQLGHELANRLPSGPGRKVREALGALGIRTVTIRAVPHLLLYDKRHIVVEADEPIEITFENPDMMPHNFVVAAPGAREEVGVASDRLVAGAAGSGATFVPDSPKVLFATPLVASLASATLAFVAPETVGDYPYMCTYLGHWIRMNGTLHVVEDVDAWIEANPGLLSEASPVREFVREWTLDDLVGDLDELDSDRMLDRGSAVFAEASCAECHRLGGAGGLIGPDLSDVAERFDTAAMLAEILVPSTTINEAYQTWLIDLVDGDLKYGLIGEETAESIRVVENPLVDGEGVEIARDRVSAMEASDVSSMPGGLLNVFTREEILDLLAYVRSGGAAN